MARDQGRLVTPPYARRVNHFTGEVANEQFFQALSEADNFVADLDTVRELQTRVQELEAELHAAKADAVMWQRRFQRAARTP